MIDADILNDIYDMREQRDIIAHTLRLEKKKVKPNKDIIDWLSPIVDNLRSSIVAAKGQLYVGNKQGNRYSAMFSSRETGRIGKIRAKPGR